MPEDTSPSSYRGSLKHKERPARGRKGTLCPEWTHKAGRLRLGNDMKGHNWSATIAHQMFEKAEESDEEPGRWFNTARGMAFEAKSTNDGTWHGYPVPWEQVPNDLKERWRKEGRVSRKELRLYLSKPKNDYRWPLESDDD